MAKAKSIEELKAEAEAATAQAESATPARKAESSALIVRAAGRKVDKRDKVTKAIISTKVQTFAYPLKAGEPMETVRFGTKVRRGEMTLDHVTAMIEALEAAPKGMTVAALLAEFRAAHEAMVANRPKAAERGVAHTEYADL